MPNHLHLLGIDIGSTTVKIAILDDSHHLVFSDYERHFANIQETLSSLLDKAYKKLGDLTLSPMITGSGGLTLAKHLGVPFVQEVIAVSTALTEYAPQTDVAIELGGEDAKIIYFEGGNVEQRMNGICAGGTGSFIDQMASLLQTDAEGLNTYAKDYRVLYPIAARCGVFAKSDIQPLINEGATKEDHSHLFAAIGSAMNYRTDVAVSLSGMRAKLSSDIKMEFEVERMEPLFRNQEEYETFKARHAGHHVHTAPLETYSGIGRRRRFPFVFFLQQQQRQSSSHNHQGDPGNLQQTSPKRPDRPLLLHRIRGGPDQVRPDAG